METKKMLQTTQDDLSDEAQKVREKKLLANVSKLKDELEKKLKSMGMIPQKENKKNG